MNRAEEYVAQLCQETFLSFWTYPNPQKPDGKELCDLLVVCPPDILIFSVKEAAFKDTGEYGVDSDRWTRRAITGSIHQLFGAERVLSQIAEVRTNNGLKAPPLPSKEVRRIHRIAIAIGGSQHVGISSGLQDNRYVHIFDAEAFGIIVQELDTITDFVDYLLAKENLKARVIMEGGEEDLLAYYLTNDCSFPPEHDMILCGENLWSTFSVSEDYANWREANRESYLWDKIIETVSQDQRSGNLLGDVDYGSVEEALRLMAREDRYSRRLLIEAFNGLLRKSVRKEARARIACSPDIATYVFLARPLGTPRKERTQELGHRCLVARDLYPENKTVVGIATEEPSDADGFSVDLVYFHIPELTEEEKALASEIRNKLGYFRRQEHVDRRD